MDLSSLTGMFVGLHATLAVMSKTPELAITEQEGKDFTKAAQNVLRHYSISTTQKTLDWLAFCGVTVGMYGSRAFAIQMRRKEERAGKSPERGTVLRFPDRTRRTPVAEAPSPTAPAPPDYVPSVVPGPGPTDDDFGGF